MEVHSLERSLKKVFYLPRGCVSITKFTTATAKNISRLLSQGKKNRLEKTSLSLIYIMG
jgi:hypothetical protein